MHRPYYEPQLDAVVGEGMEHPVLRAAADGGRRHEVERR
jgi:hypothetical protein